VSRRLSWAGKLQVDGLAVGDCEDHALYKGQSVRVATTAKLLHFHPKSEPIPHLVPKRLENWPFYP
jgi:hypothetical protein